MQKLKYDAETAQVQPDGFKDSGSSRGGTQGIRPRPAPPSPTARRGLAPHARPPAASPPLPVLQPDPDPHRTSRSPPPPRPARGDRTLPPAPPPPPAMQRLVPHLAVSPSTAPRIRQPRARHWACVLAPERRERARSSRSPAACRAPRACRLRPFPSLAFVSLSRAARPSLSSGSGLGGCG